MLGGVRVAPGSRRVRGFEGVTGCQPGERDEWGMCGRRNVFVWRFHIVQRICKDVATLQANGYVFAFGRPRNWKEIALVFLRASTE